jgi:hypothetical protein
LDAQRPLLVPGRGNPSASFHAGSCTARARASLDNVTPRVSRSRHVSCEPGPSALLTTRYRPAPTVQPSTAGALKSASFELSGGLVLLTSNLTGGLSAATVAPDATAWSALPPPPLRTAAISIASTGIDALGVNGQIFTDYHLVGHRWATAQTIGIPLAYGSSS